MKITSRDGAIAFVPWRPAMGKVFRSRFAFRGACTPPDPARPWLAPTLVAAAACDGRRGVLVARGDLGAFFAAHEGIRFVADDVAAQLEAIAVAAPKLDIYRWVDAHLVECAGLLRRLLRLATAGHTDPGPAPPIAGGRPWGRWLNRPLREVAPDDLRALADEAVALRRRHRRLRARIRRHLDDRAPAAWGFVSPAWLREQARRWGPLTIYIQVKAAIVLRAISARGLYLDPDRRAGRLAGLDAVVAEQRAILRDHGFLPGQPSSAAALRSILRRIERRRGGVLPRTPTGDYATSEEALAPLAPVEPFVKAWLAHGAAARLRDLLARLGRPVVHPSFDVLKVTGRTSSFGEVNAQAVPRDDRVRSCFAARPGFVLVAADYKAIEMATLAQSCVSQFGLDSRLAAALNAGRDPHALVAVLATGKVERWSPR